MYCPCDVFRSPEGFPFREVGVHLRRCFSPRGVLEDHLDTINCHLLEIILDNNGWWNQAQVAGCSVLTDRLIDMAERATRQKHTVLIEKASRHSVAGINILGHSVIHEPYRGDDLDFAAHYVCLISHATDASEVIGMRVRVDDRDHRALSEFLVDELQGSSSCLFGRER